MITMRFVVKIIFIWKMLITMILIIKRSGTGRVKNNMNKKTERIFSG